MKKILFTMTTLIMMALCVASCGDDDNNTTNPEQPKHGDMMFQGTSVFNVETTGYDDATQEGDKVYLTLSGAAKKQAEIVIPDLTYTMSGGGHAMTIKSFTANSGKEYTQVGTYPNLYFEWEAGDFTTTTTGTDGNEKIVSGKISAKYYHIAKKLVVSITNFRYGNMPMTMRYDFEGVFVAQ